MSVYIPNGESITIDLGIDLIIDQIKFSLLPLASRRTWREQFVFLHMLSALGTGQNTKPSDGETGSS